MERKTQQILAVAVIIIVVGAGLAIALSSNKPEPTLAEVIALATSEIGLAWGGSIKNLILDPSDSHTNSVSENNLWNDSYILDVYLTVYDTPTVSRNWYQNFSASAQSNKNTTFENITIGDGGFLQYWEFSGMPVMINVLFIKGVFFCNMWADNGRMEPKTWWIDTTIWLAQLQLQKIDQYLAQYPEAS
jgi:hypothetical protein